MEDLRREIRITFRENIVEEIRKRTDVSAQLQTVYIVIVSSTACTYGLRWQQLDVVFVVQPAVWKVR